MIFLVLIGCCQSEIEYSNLLTSTEKSLIPYFTYNNSYFNDENGNEIRASFDPRILERHNERPGPESCELEEYESLNGEIRFLSRNFVIKMKIFTHFESRFLTLTEYFYGDQTFGVDFNIDCNNATFNLDNIKLDDKLENIELLNFEFKKVIVIENCSVDSTINKMIISPNKGLIFILYKDNSYLKLID